MLAGYSTQPIASYPYFIWLVLAAKTFAEKIGRQKIISTRPLPLTTESAETRQQVFYVCTMARLIFAPRYDI